MDWSDYEVDGQLSIFDLAMEEFKISKPIRLIELFAGVGSQAMALRDLGADFEHYKISEWEYNSNSSYKAIHSLDNTDYSFGMARKEVVDALMKLGISADGKKPMTYKGISRKSEIWQRAAYIILILKDNTIREDPRRGEIRVGFCPFGFSPQPLTEAGCVNF